MDLLGNIFNPKVIVIGCFHGDEPQGKLLIDSYTNCVKDSNLLFIPCLNVYGYQNNTRLNENGVDLNRNFPTKNWEHTQKDNFYGGKFPASEIQTRFVIDIVEKYKPELILTLHAPYKVVNYDCSGNYDKDILISISKIMNYPIEESIGYPTPGSFGTWAGIEKGILTITLELDENVPIKELEPLVFNVFKYLEDV